MSFSLSKAALCAAFLIPLSAIGSETMIEHRGLSIECSKQDNQIRLLFTSDDQRGRIQLLSGSNRLSSTINKGSTVNYSMNVEQFPVTVIYDSEGKESEFTISSDCVPE